MPDGFVTVNDLDDHRWIRAMAGKLDLAITAIPGGVALVIRRHGETDLFVPMPLDRATVIFTDWWKALSSHYPGVRTPDPDATELPMVMVTGDGRLKVGAGSDGLVRLMLQPREYAGLGFELRPEQARDLALELHRAADAIEQFRAPN